MREWYMDVEAVIADHGALIGQVSSRGYSIQVGPAHQAAAQRGAPEVARRGGRVGDDVCPDGREGAIHVDRVRAGNHWPMSRGIQRKVLTRLSFR